MKKHLKMANLSYSVKLGSDCLNKLRQILDSPTFTTTNIDGKHVCQIGQSFLQSSSLPDQISHLKQLVTLAVHRNTSQATVELVLQFLLSMYFDAEIQKSSLYKPIAKCLDSIDEAITQRMYVGKVDIKRLILDQAKKATTGKEFISSVKCLAESPIQTVRYQTVTHHFSAIVTAFIPHLIACLQQLAPDRNGRNAKAHIENVSLAHTACQIFFRLLSMPGHSKEQALECCQKVKPLLVEALLKGYGNMDLLISIGLCIAQLTNRESDGEDEGDVLNKVELLLTRDSAVTDQHFVQCCLLNGIISCFKHCPLALHQLILHTCCHLTTVKMNTTNLLVFMKMLVTWTSSLSREPQGRDFIEQEAYQPLLSYLWLVWEHSSETVRQSSREVFANLLRSVSSNDMRLETLQFLKKYSWLHKGKYGFLHEYVLIAGVEETLLHLSEPGATSLLLEILGYIKYQHLANYVSEFVCCIMKCDKKAHSYTPAEWTERWLIPLVEAVEGKPDTRTNVSQNLLPRIIKVWPETIVELLRRMADDKIGSSEQVALSYNLPASSHDQSADIYLMLARRARTSGLLSEEAQDEETWCGVLNRKRIDSSLHSSCPKRRLSAFALVCESHKTSCAIQKDEFKWVSEFVRDNSYHSDASFRQQMLSHLKHFLYHVLESNRKLDSVSQRPYQEFLRALGMMQVERLATSSLANYRIIGLEILNLLSNIFPFGTFSEH
ncbi:tRNA (32-2'-O)-methyltransferase regulator THADA-like [Watersipora subatra]|uniref:tRNA (32-2'-O)-methyltransferase regulator THADA-like n=1 Tax=Watersipora subatra TaxID=2589382 RepID=UPI00355B378B